MVFCQWLNGCSPSAQIVRKPNFIVIFCDDLGYGDLGVYGHPTIRTPNLDQLAAEGQKWTSFYAAASVCTPSRAALLTGRLPIRSGMCSDQRRVLFPNSAGGLPSNEMTIAEALKTVGYATACIGKWHLGHLSSYLPTKHGFDYYFGIPYSNDMDAVEGWNYEDFFDPKIEYWNVPLMRNDEIIERPADQTTVTKRYADEAVRFIQENKDRSFFLYLAHSMPHVPLFASESFLGRSVRGLYGDVIEEIDWSVGQILTALQKEGLSENTLVVFTSDNGPWLVFREHGGSAGPLRNGKGTTWEGGMREPAVFWWPGKIEPGIVQEMGSTLDLFSTFCNLSGAEIPNDRIIDGVDLGPTLFENGPSPRQTMFFYRGEQIYAARRGSFKAHFITQSEYVPDTRLTHHDPPLLYNLNHDLGEQYDISMDYPEVIADIIREVDRHKANLVAGEDQLVGRIENNEQ
jgi:arylsulfatase A-like enzyme